MVSVSRRDSSSALLVITARPSATIVAMTTTPETQDWLRLAEEAFSTESHAESDAQLDRLEQLRWRLRRPAR